MCVLYTLSVLHLSVKILYVIATVMMFVLKKKIEPQ